MKFSHSLQFNAVPEWVDHYIPYEKLKSTIYQIEKSLVAAEPAVNRGDIEETESLLRPTQDSVNAEFIQELNDSLDTVCRFYSSMETKLINQFEQLLNEIRKTELYQQQSILHGSTHTTGIGHGYTWGGGYNNPLQQQLHHGLPGFHTRSASYSTPSAAAAVAPNGGVGVSGNTHGTRSSFHQHPSLHNTNIVVPGGASMSHSPDELVDRRNQQQQQVESSRSRMVSESAVVASPSLSSFNQSNNNNVSISNNDNGNTINQDTSKPEKHLPSSINTSPTTQMTPRDEINQFVTSTSSATSAAAMHPNLYPMTDHFAALIWQSKLLKPEKFKLKIALTDIYVLLCDLRGYVELNYTAFNKILKKYEKVSGFKLKRKYISSIVDTSYPFKPETKDYLNRIIDRAVSAYARICTDANLALAQTELNSHLRERIVWERNTIWRDMIERERRHLAIKSVVHDANGVGGLSKSAASHVAFSITVWETTIHVPKQLLTLMVCVSVFIMLLQGRVFQSVEQNHCFALLIFASMLWAFEAIPLFVTSIMIPFLVVILRVLRDPTGKTNQDGQPVFIRLDAKLAAKRIFSEMFSPVIMLLLGGFALAAALSKHNIAKGMASFILAKAGSKPSNVILANMFVSTFASMWISNVAAPVLCFSLINPILRNLPHRSPYAKSLILGIALAANVGGMASPISSPQNIIAVGNMSPEVSWLQWFMISWPICIVTDLIIWGILVLAYQPNNEHQTTPPELFGKSVVSSSSSGIINHGGGAADINIMNSTTSHHQQQQSTSSLAEEGTPNEIRNRRNSRTMISPINNTTMNNNVGRMIRMRGRFHNILSSIKHLSWTQIYICAVTLITIGLWCAEHTLEVIVGDMGVIAILPMIAFFGPGILSKEDFNNFLWTVIMLAMGGTSLGKAVQSSGLLTEITQLMVPFLSGLSAFECMMVLTAVVLVMTTFVSHTVGALILMPVISQLGQSLPDPQPRILVMSAALMCSGAMGLPVSSFPNMNAVSLEDPTGIPWLNVNDFLKIGLLGSVIAYVAIVFIGYGIMAWMKFH